MQTYKFQIGRTVFLAAARSQNVPGGAYIVTKRLPENNGEFEDRVKSVAECDCAASAKAGLTGVDICRYLIRPFSAVILLAYFIGSPRRHRRQIIRFDEGAAMFGGFFWSFDSAQEFQPYGTRLFPIAGCTLSLSASASFW
jgi:hypothetical protein